MFNCVSISKYLRGKWEVILCLDLKVFKRNKEE